ncbi:MAG TPA: carbohydrate-binding family 9-like protein [Myxococcota bacterium]|nr:carbohydrate-binding family 9-like protein [Myxococcota bacterium]HQK50313.1 carbohydrate-binding family 9-like protein [Myxococcota bacterium]
MRKAGRIALLWTIGLLLLVGACRKPVRVILTKDQQARIAADILKEKPAPQFPSGAVFDGRIRLLGADMEPQTPRAGTEVTITWYWECLQATPGDWKVFGHLELPGGKRMVLDHVPVQELYPVSQWKPGEVIRDIQKVTLDPEAKTGQGVLWGGLFSEEIYQARGGGDRMPISNKGEVQNDGQDRVRVLQFRLEGKDAPPRAPAVLQVLPAAGAIAVDGRLDEEAWTRAIPVKLQAAGGGPAPAGQGTAVKALWDDQALYLAFDCQDDQISSPYRDRDDELWNGDVVEVYLDPKADGKDYLEIQVSPNNVVFDALFQSRRQPDWHQARSHNVPGMKTAALEGPRDKGMPWTVEMAIPWTSLPEFGKAPAVGDEVRLNLFRIQATDGKVTGAQAFSPAEGDFHDLSKAGVLRLVAGPAEASSSEAAPGAGRAPAQIQVAPGSLEALKAPRPAPVSPGTARVLQHQIQGTAPRK